MSRRAASRRTRSCRCPSALARPSPPRAPRARRRRVARALDACSRARRLPAATHSKGEGCRTSGAGLQLLWTQCSSSKTSRKGGAFQPVAFEQGFVKGLDSSSLGSEPHCLIAHGVLLRIAERVDLG